MGVTLNFDASRVQPSTGVGDPIPAGWYNVAVDESEMKPTTTGTGMYLKLRFNILDGQYVGRKLFVNLNLQNPNQQAVEIALKDLSAICHAVQHIHLADSSQLHGKPLKVRVGLKPADKEAGYDAQNVIKAYREINFVPEGAGGGAAPAFAPPAFGAPPASAGGPPAAPAGWGAPAPAAAGGQPWAAPGGAAPATTAAPATAPAWTPPAGGQPWAAPGAQAPAAAAGAAAAPAGAPPWAVPR